MIFIPVKYSADDKCVDFRFLLCFIIKNIDLFFDWYFILIYFSIGNKKKYIKTVLYVDHLN